MGLTDIQINEIHMCQELVKPRELSKLVKLKY